MTQPIAPSFCSRCGTQVNAGAHYCAVCGTDVSGQQASLLTEQIQAQAPRPQGPDAMWEEQQELLRQATLGEYEILGELGRGGMAAVYLAHEIALDRKVAIKVMSPTLVHGDGMIERFKREARTAASLSHPNIIPVYAVRETDQLLYFVMKFISGRPLDSVLKELGPLPVPMTQMILNQVGSAFGYAHRRGIVHRDIKPANIMIDDEGWAVVTDFGIAKVSQAEGLTMTGMTVGTPTYMSPEQCMAQDVTGASDQYSLGVVAYEMVTGRPPFAGGSMMAIMYGHFNDPPPPIEQVRADCPEDLRTAILRMLEKDPAKRWPTMEAAVEAIGDPPAKSDDVMRSQLIDLAKKSQNTALLQRLSTPISPTPLTKRTKAGVPPGPRGPTSNPRAAGATRAAAAAAPTLVHSPPPRAAAAPAPKSKAPLIGGAVAVVGLAAALLVWKPWAKPVVPVAATNPPVDTSAAVAPDPGVVTPPATDPAATTGQPAESVAAPAPPQPTPTAPDPAELRRARQEYTRELSDASNARDRALRAGATAAELRQADGLKRQGEQLGGREDFGGAVDRLGLATTAYGVAENAAALRTQRAQAADPRLHPQPSPAVPETEPQHRPLQPGETGQQAAAPVVPPPVIPSNTPAQTQPAAVDERPSVELAIRDYARALAASDLTGMQAVYPAMPGTIRQAWQEFFKQKFSLDTSRWKLLDVTVSGSTATVQISGSSIQRDKRGKEQTVPPPKGATLEKGASGWRITSIN